MAAPNTELEGIISQEMNAGRGAAPVTLTYRGRTLRLGHGANKFEWAYQLKTSTTSTYGGEVIQVLGASVGPIMITGTAASMAEHSSIKDWFVGVMTALGTGERRNDAVRLEYPERGWVLDIVPIQFGPWELDNANMAPDWFLTAEIVSPTANSLSTHTMSTKYGIPDSSKLAPYAFDFWRYRFDPAFASAEKVYSDADIEEFGNSLDKTLAHIVAGGLDLFGRATGEDMDADEVYEKAFGSKWLVKPDGGEGSGEDWSGGEPTSKLQIVAAVNSIFEAADIPGQLGVTVAMIESANSWDPNIINTHGYMGLFQTQSSGRGGGGPKQYRDEVKAAEAAISGKTIKSPWDFFPEISANYPASSQINHAANWFNDCRPTSAVNKNDRDQMINWAFRAQGIAESPSDQATYQRIWDARWEEAGRLIEQSAEVANVVGSTQLSPLSGSALSQAIVNHPRFLGFDNNAARNDILNYESVGVNEVVPKAIHGILEAGWTLHISSVKTNRGGANHGPGRAVDFNNYGPGGAYSNAGGTSSTDPRAFISFLKKNRAALGGLRIGYGSPSAGAGADFADKTNHVHVDWTGSV